MDLGHVRALLARRSFRDLLSTRLTGQLADGLLQAGLVGVVLFAPERGTSPARIAMGFAVLLLPFTLLAPLAGVLLDRWSRVAVLRWANLGRALLIAVTAAATAWGASEVLVFGTALVALALNRLVLAALGASLPRTVPSDLLVTGNAMAPTLGTFTTVVGGAIGLLLRGVLEGPGDAAPFAAAAVGYLVAAGTTVRFSSTQLGPGDHAPLGSPFAQAWDDVCAGVAQIARTAPARSVLLATTAQRILFGGLTVWTIVTIRFLLHGTSSDEDAALAALGTVAFAAGIGLVAASTVAPSMVRRLGPRFTTAAALAVGAIGSLAPAASLRLTSIVTAWLFAGASAQALKITVDTTLQRSSPDAMRGRVFIAYDLVFNISFMLGVSIVAAASLSLLDGSTLPVLLAAGYVAAASLVQLSRRAQWEAAPEPG